MTSSAPPADAAPDRVDLPLPPGRFGLPLLGETLEFAASPAAFADKRNAAHGPIFRSHVLGTPMVFMMGAEANRWIFAGENKYLQNKWTYGVRRLLGAQCVAMLNGDAHRARRRELAPHFTYDALRTLVPTVEQITQRHLAQWSATTNVLTLFPAVRALVFEIAVALILGDTKVDIPYLSGLFRTWTAGLFAPVPIDLPWTTFGRAIKAGQELRASIKQIVVERQAQAEPSSDILGSLLSVRDEQGQPLPLETIIDEIQLQLFAGHDTTVSATSNLMMLLAQHLPVLERCRAEQQQPELHGPITLDTIRQMTYLHQTINEGLRCIPPIGGAFRVTTQDVSYGGYRIPKGWTIAINPRAAHNGPNWTTPEQFDPDRWGPERAEHKQAACSFIAFGGGPRMCLGQNFAMIEMCAVLALLLREYRWELAPNQDLRINPLPIPQPRSGIKVHFGRR